MRHQVSLKLVVAFAFLSLAVILVFGYTLLSNHFFHKGMDSAISMNMTEVGRGYAQSLPLEKRENLEHFSGYLIAPKWNQLPLEIRESFNNQPPTAKNPFMVKVDRPNLFEHPDSVTFVFRYDENNEQFFVGKKTYRRPGPSLLGKNAEESRRMLYLISGAIALVLAVTILFILHYVAKPVATLEQWTRSLDSQNLNQQPPDFSYPELNKLADLVRTSLSSVQESLDREQNFLRYASHELRTPIAIIRNNLELFPKIEKLQEPKRSLQQNQVIDRIDRASLNMQHLTETLLWLSKDTIETLPGKPLALDSLLRQLVEDMRYLIDRKNIQLHVETNPCSVIVPEIPAQIVLGNLVRNAFQHTWEGSITIKQQGNRVDISNTYTENDIEQQDLGFGLGLQLTTELAQKLDWLYTDDSEHLVHRVSITFTGSP